MYHSYNNEKSLLLLLYYVTMYFDLWIIYLHWYWKYVFDDQHHFGYLGTKCEGEYLIWFYYMLFWLFSFTLVNLKTGKLLLYNINDKNVLKQQQSCVLDVKNGVLYIYSVTNIEYYHVTWNTLNLWIIFHVILNLCHCSFYNYFLVI